MKYRIIGDDMQAVVVSLAPQEAVAAEAGHLMYMTDGVEMETTLSAQNQGMLGGLMSGLKRVVAGESFFVTLFKAHRVPGDVTFSAPYPGKIIPVNLAEMGDMLCQRDAYLCSDPVINISVAWTKKFGAGLFGGEGFILQKLTGSGMAFIHACGMIVPLDLKAGETIRADAGSLVAMTAGVDFDIQMVSGVKSWLFSGEGLFYVRLTGPGRVYLQTLPFSRLAGRILSAAGSSREGGTPASSANLLEMGGSVLGGLGGLFDRE